jgi:hypothetical protein
MAPKSGKTKAMQRFAMWCYSNANLLLLGAICFLAGVGLSVPLGWKLPDTITSLFGSVAGAIGAVGGAFLLWQAQEARAAIRLGESIAITCLDARNVLEKFAHQLGKEVDGNAEEEMARGVRDEAELARKRLQRYDESLATLTTPQQIAVTRLHDYLLQVRYASSDFLEQHNFRDFDRKKAMASFIALLIALIAALRAIAPKSQVAQDASPSSNSK